MERGRGGSLAQALWLPRQHFSPSFQLWKMAACLSHLWPCGDGSPLAGLPSSHGCRALPWEEGRFASRAPFALPPSPMWLDQGRARPGQADWSRSDSARAQTQFS